ncbi:MAG: asparagine synthase (glutamine-hydrolyzing) [Planctomycetes bacterium]|nr:asparagine synthase (glutamine-hydrolyzing) [Planctomycetota bacterium]
MCGIVGQIRFDGGPVDADEIQRMCDAVAHRGPDGEGKHVQANVGLGHRRLAIIDLAGGAQPMGTPDGRVWVTFNGEIYNFKQLRSELQAAGFQFRTNSDTEVLLHGWLAWGNAMVAKLRGMFAFCVVDFERQAWLLARDPFGIKPLCYRLETEGVTFASELHPLKRAGETCSLETVEWFLRYQYIPEPFSIYAGIRKLPAAHWLEGDFEGNTTGPERYWHLVFHEQAGVSEADWLDRFDAAMRESVSAHLLADVPVGVLLSGGVDSTLIACAAAGISAERMKAFTIDFDVPGFGELEYATRAAAECGLALESGVVSDNFWEDLPELVRHYGEPFGDNSCVPTWQLAKLARQHVPVVLAGDGGDEAFAGYRSYKRWLRKPDLESRFAALRKRPNGETLVSLGWALAARVGMRSNRRAEWERNIAYVAEADRDQLWQKTRRGVVNAGCPAFVDAAEDEPPPGPVSWAQHMDFRTYLPGAILVKSDIASMFHGLEIRTPFLDVEMLKLACALPESLRARVEGKNVILKYLPKQALRRKFDDAFVNRPKKGFGGPRERWFHEGRPGRAYLRKVVLDHTSGLHEWFDMKLVERWIDEHSPEINHSPALWLLLVLGLWRQGNPDVRFA